MVARGATDAHRPLGKEHDLASIRSHVEERIVTSDYTLRYQGKVYQRGRSEIRPGLRGGRVRVEQRLDGSLAVQFRQRYLGVTECHPQPKVTPPRPSRAVKSPRPKAASDWMKNFNLQKRPPMWSILKSEKTGVPQESGLKTRFGVSGERWWAPSALGWRRTRR